MRAIKGIAATLKKLRSSSVGIIDNFPIRIKLFAYAAVLVTLLLLLAGFVLVQINEIRQQHIPARAAARDMEAALLNMRIQELNFTNEADSLNIEFYLKQKSASVDAWQENYRVLEANHTKLSGTFKRGEVKRELDIIQPLVTKYRDIFIELTGSYRERGFQAFGREGVLKQRADILQANLANTNVLVTFLKLQETQDKFLLYREVSAIATFNDQAAQLRAQLTRANDRMLLDEYTRMFEEVVAIHKKIGLVNTEGLRGQLNQLTSEITPHLQLAEATVLQLTSDNILSINQSIYVATVVLTIVAVLLAFMLARLITRRIALLSDASTHIASGDFGYRLPAHASDELGQLSQSFNIMAEQLQKGREKLHDRALALSQSVKRFELVSRIVNEAIYEWDVKTGKLTWGEGIVTVFGYRPSDKVTTIDWWTDRIHSEDTEAIDTSLSDRIRRHASNWKKDYRFRKASGEYVYCQDRGFIEYRNGEAVRLVGSIIDISRQKALDRAKDEFISVASHQLRTPLGSIRWNLELLLEKEKTLPSALAEYTQEAYTSTLRMAGLVNDLLSVARIEQDRVQNIPEKTDLTIVIKSAIDEMQSIAKRHKVHVANISKVKHAEVFLDPKRFREVVQNLLSNAVKYTHPGGKVTVKIEQQAKDFVMSVSDDGIGIPLEDQSKLFAKFYRATNVTTTDTEGSGLGLFVVRSYVEAWRGRVWFTSQVNNGTTFYVSIPHKPRVPKVSNMKEKL